MLKTQKNVHYICGVHHTVVSPNRPYYTFFWSVRSSVRPSIRMFVCLFRTGSQLHLLSPNSTQFWMMIRNPDRCRQYNRAKTSVHNFGEIRSLLSNPSKKANKNQIIEKRNVLFSGYSSWLTKKVRANNIGRHGQSNKDVCVDGRLVLFACVCDLTVLHVGKTSRYITR